MKLYHQVGHNDVWNRDSFTEDGAGDGLILAPRYMSREKVESVDPGIKKVSLFDTQFFLPDNAYRHLQSYSFHPDVVASGFDTTDFVGNQALESAKNCLDFQARNDFAGLVIPTRYVSGMPTDLTDQLQKLFVEPYLKAWDSIGVHDEDLFLQLVLNDDMINDDAYRSQILNWATGFSEIDGIYLIVEKSPRHKQIRDADYLLRLLTFVDELRNARMEVVVGYCNTEAIILSVAHPTAVTMGAYENMRMFKIRTFRETEGEMRGPTARIYSSRLLQWISHGYVENVARTLDTTEEDFFEDNEYQATIFSPPDGSHFNWHFTKPSLYKHFFIVFNRQLTPIKSKKGKDRFVYVRELVKDAHDLFQRLEQDILFDSEGGGDHLPAWYTAINTFAKIKGWR